MKAWPGFLTGIQRFCFLCNKEREECVNIVGILSFRNVIFFFPDMFCTCSKPRSDNSIK